MNLLEKIGLAVRDGVYEIFMEYTKTTDLKELKESGFRVKEIPLSPDPHSMDRLYILTKEDNIHCSCSLVIEGNEPEVKLHTGIETKELLRHIKQSVVRESRPQNKIH